MCKEKMEEVKCVFCDSQEDLKPVHACYVCQVCKEEVETLYSQGLSQEGVS